MLNQQPLAAHGGIKEDGGANLFNRRWLKLEKEASDDPAPVSKPTKMMSSKASDQDRTVDRHKERAVTSIGYVGDQELGKFLSTGNKRKVSRMRRVRALPYSGCLLLSTPAPAFCS